MKIAEARKIVEQWRLRNGLIPGRLNEELIAKLVQREVNKAQKRIPIKGINPMNR